MQEHQHANIDILGFCGTARGEYVREAEYQMHAAMFSVATGMNMDVDGLLTAAERCINIERAFQVRDGVTRKDDIVPEFFFKTPILDGPQKGRMLDKAKFEKLKGEYYEARGWDVETGKPTRTKLEALGLMDIADDLEKRGMLPIVKKARTVRERRAK
jgi:aldehyde:ferredoxin oxidoreductase